MAVSQASKTLLVKIKPLLSSLPIMHAGIDMSLNNISTITVEFAVTPELLKAMAGDGSEFLHLMADAPDGT